MIKPIYLYGSEVLRQQAVPADLEKKEEPIDIDSLSPEQMKELLKKMMGQQ